MDAHKQTADPPVDVRGMRILVADDYPANREYMCEVLKDAGYREVLSTAEAREVPRLCSGPLPPDLLLLDLNMPGMSGYEVLGEIRPLLTTPPYLAVIVITGETGRDAKRRALSLGANDFLTKPFDGPEMLLRVGNLLRSHRLRHSLNDLVAERTTELERARLETLECLAAAAEYRDDDTGRHTQRVGHTSALIAGELGLDEDTVRLIRLAAPLHDVGKIGIPDAILLKPGPLTDSELLAIRRHVEIGAEILAHGSSPEMKLAHDIALHHHERWDGTGYGRGLAGAQTPITARITAAADSFDAMTHARPYKEAWTLDRALTEMAEQRALQFDPDVVDAFMRLDHGTLIEPVRSVHELTAEPIAA
jgi:putative two-component system response regulator